MTLTPEERVTSDVIAPEEVLEGERGSLITGLVIARAWRDPDYLARLLDDPGEVLAAAGLQLRPGVRIRVFLDAPGVRHVALTSLTSEPEEMLPLLRELLPLPEGSEIRLIQNTEQALCLVVPPGPGRAGDADRRRGAAPARAPRLGLRLRRRRAEHGGGVHGGRGGPAGRGRGVGRGGRRGLGVHLGRCGAERRRGVHGVGGGPAGAAEASAASSAQSAATAAAAAASSTSVSTNTNQVTNTFAVAEAQVDAVAQAAVAVAGVEAEAVATTTTAAAEAEAVAVAVIVLT